MSRPSFLFALVVGVLANLTFVTSSQAGSVVTVKSNVQLPPTVTSITSLDVTLSGVPPWSDWAVLVPSGATFTTNVNTFEISFTPNESAAFILLGQAFATFTFDVPGDGTGITATSTSFATNTGNLNGTSAVHVAGGAVPEPASMSLLAVGMAGLVALRRCFRRNTNTSS